MSPPTRRATDHVHPEYWTESDQQRYEDRIDRRLEALGKELKSIGQRITLMLGALGLIAFLLPVLAPLIQSLVGVPQGPTP